jgi:phage/conjugal plasmid C-4 type zinc finger TraR family protein
MDEADRAQQHIEREAAAREAARRAATSRRRASLSCCARCEAPIPEARRLALPGVQLCIDCAGEVEGLRARGLL